jgi:hypothetical protein
MSQDIQRRMREQDVAIFLHKRLHKSQKILVCKSDMELAQEIVSLFETGEPLEDDERPRVSSRRVQTPE